MKLRKEINTTIRNPPMRCPICEQVFEPSESNALPFCSPRCRTVDLGRWLGESYGMPALPDEDALEALTVEQPADDSACGESAQ